MVAVLIAIHNLAVLGEANWPAVSMFLFVGVFYGLGSWLMLRVSFLESRKLPLGTVFLVLDIPILLFAIHVTGGPGSWLFLLLAARCTDQIFFGVRRVIWVSHVLVGSYALYLAVVSTSSADFRWQTEAAKLAILYAFTWYYALTARNVDLVRRRSRRSNAVKRERAELTGTVSHAIATRTAAVTAVLESLRKGPLDHKQREHVQVLGDVNQSLIQLVNVLNSAENQPVQMATDTHRFQVKEMLADVALLVRPLADSKGLDLRIDTATVESLWVTGDSGRIRQALLSLAHNAVRFTDYGFVELRAWRVQPGRIGFEVKDSGSGIPIHVQRRLLAPYVRADGSPWHRTRGPGIGLGMTRRLVESIGGELGLNSALGMGTSVRFTLYLPDSLEPDGLLSELDPAPPCRPS